MSLCLPLFVCKLLWALIYLSAYPENQQKIMNGFTDITAEEEFLDVQICKKNPYLTACLYETMRISHALNMGWL